MVWAFLACLLVAGTKYFTSQRLRNLLEKIQKDQQDTEELREALSQVADKENLLKSQNENLTARITALQNIIVNIEKALIKSKDGQSPPSS